MEQMALEILRYSGDWVPEISSQIFEIIKDKFNDMVIYYGPKEDF